MNALESNPGKIRSANESSGADSAGVMPRGGSGADMNMNGPAMPPKAEACSMFTRVNELAIDSITNADVDST